MSKELVLWKWINPEEWGCRTPEPKSSCWCLLRVESSAAPLSFAYTPLHLLPSPSCRILSPSTHILFLIIRCCDCTKQVVHCITICCCCIVAFRNLQMLSHQFPFLLRPVLNPSHQRHHFLMNRSITVKLIIEGETRGSLVGGRHFVPL